MIQRVFFRRTSALVAAPWPAVRSYSFRPEVRSSPLIAQISRQRGYATEPEGKKTEGEKGDEADAAKAGDLMKKELEAKSREALDLKDKYLRSVADFRNLQERTKRDMQSAKDFAIQKFAKDLVESVDNLDRALAMVPEEKLTSEEKSEHLRDLVSLYEGLRMTEGILLNTLKTHGLERIDSDNAPFDPNMMEAVFMTPHPEKEDNIVLMTQRKGWKLNNRVLRAAQVGVVKNK